MAIAILGSGDKSLLLLGVRYFGRVFRFLGILEKVSRVLVYSLDPLQISVEHLETVHPVVHGLDAVPFVFSQMNQKGINVHRLEPLYNIDIFFPSTIQHSLKACQGPWIVF